MATSPHSVRLEVVVFRPSCERHVDLQKRLTDWVRLADVPYVHSLNPILRAFVHGPEGGVSEQHLTRPFTRVRSHPARRLSGKQPGERAVGCGAEVVPDSHSDPALRSAGVEMGRALGEEVDSANRGVVRNLVGDDRLHRHQGPTLALKAVNEVSESLILGQRAELVFRPSHLSRHGGLTSPVISRA